MHAYIDESGDVGYTKKSTRYFILTAVISDDLFMLRRIAKKVYKSKVGKKKSNILHAYRETKAIKNRLVREISHRPVMCIAWVLDKNNISVHDPYMWVIDKIVNHLKNTHIQNIILSRRDTRKNYNNQIIKKFESRGIQVFFSDPSSEKALQIADFYSWSIFSSIEYGFHEYFDLLKENIVLNYLEKAKPPVDVWAT